MDHYILKMSMDRINLLNKLVAHFNIDELKTLCFHLNVEYEVLPGEGKVTKIRELITYLERRNRILDLWEICNRLRPESFTTIKIGEEADKLSEVDLSKTNSKIKTSLLFLASDPSELSRLRLGEEIREIKERLQLSNLRDNFILHQSLAVRPLDVSQALLDSQANIVHFSGHGTSDGALCFQNQSGNAYLVRPDSLAYLFEQFTAHVQCVLLNACYSEKQADAIAKHIDYVIGMNQELDDLSAISFSAGFYQGIGAGRSVEDAYKLGCVQMRLQSIQNSKIPILMKNKNVKPPTNS